MRSKIRQWRIIIFVLIVELSNFLRKKKKRKENVKRRRENPIYIYFLKKE